MPEPDLADWITAWEDGVPPDPRDDIDTASLVAAQPELGSVEVSDLDISGVPARLYGPARPVGEVLVWAHGGAFVAGSLDMPEAHWVALALAARGVTVVSVDYRRCVRGVHYPLPSDDLLAAWRWAVENSEGKRVHLGGASAGSALAASAVLRLRDAGERVPDSLVLAYPVVHAELPAPGDEILGRIAGLDASLVFTPELIHEISSNYVGPGGDLTDPHAFAGHGELHGHPPTLIVNSDRDSLRASGELYGRQLADAGAPVCVEVEPGTTHGHLDQPHSEGALRSVERIAAWLTTHTSNERSEPCNGSASSSG